MTYQMTEFGTDILNDTRSFCARDVAKLLARADETEIWPEEVITEAREQGYTALWVPEELGGFPLTMQDRAAVLEELAACDAGLAVTFMGCSLAGDPVFSYGSPEQRQFAADILLSGGLGAFCLTEDEAGSDISRCRAKAVREGDFYRISGSKSFVTNGPVAGFYVVFAQADGGLTAFLVDAGEEGILPGADEKKMGIRNSRTSEVSFDNVKVSESFRIGEEGEGGKIALSALTQARIWCGVCGTGIARASRELAAERVKERVQFCHPLSQEPVIRQKLADMYLKEEAARACCAAALSAMEENSGKKELKLRSSCAKILGSEAAVFCASEAVQLFGGYGYSREYPVEKLLRDARVFPIFEGTNEIQRQIIGSQILGI